MKELFVGENQLKELLAKEPNALTSLEMEILRARRSYLTDEQLVKYGLNETNVEPTPEVGATPVSTPEVEVPVKAKKAKKSK